MTRWLLGLVLLGVATTSAATTRTYEAETAVLNQCDAATWVGGYGGAGYVVCEPKGSSVTWTVNAPWDGEYRIGFRYGLRQNAAHPGRLTVNQAPHSTVAFPPPNSCAEWLTADVTVTLDQGYNQVMLTAQTPKGLPNLDAIEVTPLDQPEGLCGMATENNIAVLECPAGETISTIGFASYGLPEGSCGGGFTRGDCHAETSVEVVERLCLGKRTCEVPATNGTFGDPCQGRPKRVAVRFTCGDDVPPVTNGLRAFYYDTIDFTGAPIERVDPQVDFNWGRGAPMDSMGADTFSVRWEGYVRPPESGTYRFHTVSDDGVRLIIGSTTVIENWTNHPPTQNTGTIELQGGDPYPLTLEYYERGGGAVIQLAWEGPGFGRTLVPTDVLTVDPDDPPTDLPVKVFVLAGQSNMVGFGTVSNTPALIERNGGLGTLETLVTDPATAAQFGHLGSPGAWSTRDDVWVVGLDRQGPLGVGFGASSDHYGPELQFGHVLGDYYENPVLLIKIAWGGKDLYRDFRPPSSGDQVGPYYIAMLDRVNEVLDELDRFMPSYRDQGYEIAGFGWHQGWNDRVNQVANDEYLDNCVNLVNDLRDDLGEPQMPFVLATTGMSGWDETHPRALSLMAAQLAVPTDPRLDFGAVRAVDTRDYWRDADVSPSAQGYHWNRNAETYFLIGNGMGEAMTELLAEAENPCGEFCGVDVDIEHVYTAQTHVLPIDTDVMKLVADRPALLKAQVTAPQGIAAPPVTAVLSLGERQMTMPLGGPSVLPTEFNAALGVVEHSMVDSFTGLIPAQWVQPGLHVTVRAADEHREYDVAVGAPTRVVMSMFDVHYFQLSPGDYPAGWKEELQAKWPVADLEVRRLNNIVFDELVIPPRANLPAARVRSKQDYKDQTGQNFDGEQAAALHWKSALKAAAGTAGRWSLYYVNIYGVNAGGQAGGFGGVGNGTAEGILSHELGHALSLPHWGTNAAYPYKGDMYGIPAPKPGEPHVGPTWGFDLPTQTFLPPTVQPNSVGGTVGQYKRDPMWGGGRGDQEQGFLLRHFSDYSEAQMQRYLEGHVVRWNDLLGGWATWDQTTADYTGLRTNNGVEYPIERDIDVVSVMVAVSGSNTRVNFIYPPIGPYRAGLIRLFDPRDPADRADAAAMYCPRDGCDVTVRLRQGAVERYYMVAAEWQPEVDPLSGGSLKTRAINLRASDGPVGTIELLLTPDVQTNGLPAQPEVLYRRDP